MTDLEVLPHGDGASDFQISKGLAIMRHHLAVVVDYTHVQEDVRPPADDKPGSMKCTVPCANIRCAKTDERVSECEGMEIGFQAE